MSVVDNTFYLVCVVFFFNWYVKLFSLKEFQLSFCTTTKSVAVLIQILFHLSCFHFESHILIFLVLFFFFLSQMVFQLTVSLKKEKAYYKSIYI